MRTEKKLNMPIFGFGGSRAFTLLTRDGNEKNKNVPPADSHLANGRTVRHQIAANRLMDAECFLPLYARTLTSVLDAGFSGWKGLSDEQSLHNSMIERFSPEQRTIILAEKCAHSAAQAERLKKKRLKIIRLHSSLIII